MSIVAFKKKSVINYGTKRSGKQPGGNWLPQGPFGNNTSQLYASLRADNNQGFSINGGYRNVGYIGKSSAMSKNGTPFRGQYAYGSGGTYGKYYSSEPVLNINEVNVLGDQNLYIKQSVLSTKGMLSKKYKWMKGQYPNYWVKPMYGTSNLSETSSQGMYIHNLTTSNMCVNDVNNPDKYETAIKQTSPTLCYTSGARFTYNDMVRNGPYVKQLKQSRTSSEHTLMIQRKCASPEVSQKPFPYAVNGDACNSIHYNKPPLWYTR